MAIILLIKRRSTLNGFISQERCSSHHTNAVPCLPTSLIFMLLPSTQCPSLGALTDVLRVSVTWSASVLVLAKRERLRGTAGWVQRLEGSSVLAQTPVATAKALHLFIF